MLTKLLIRVLFFSYLIRKTKWIRIFRNYSKSSSNIVLLAPSFPQRLNLYLRSGVLESDFALLDAVVSSNIPFRIILGSKNVDNIQDSLIYHNLSSFYGKKENQDYTDVLLDFQKRLLNRSNVLIPSHEDSRYWENKIYMHERFLELDISHPKTFVVSGTTTMPKSTDFTYPVLFKPAHSAGSQGIEKMDNPEALEEHIRKTSYKEYLIQEWIDMRRDLRLIYIGDELVVHYWRINQDPDWKPTATTGGSSADFVSLPTQWLPYIKDQYKRLGLKTGAFDITWQNDDLNTTPLILEVSPSYMPNPSPKGKYRDLPYSDYKKALFGQDAYYKNYIDLVFDLKKKLVSIYQQPN